MFCSFGPKWPIGLSYWIESTMGQKREGNRRPNAWARLRGGSLRQRSPGNLHPFHVQPHFLRSTAHEPGTSHYELLRAFLTDAELERLTTELNMREYHTHEFGDSVLASRTFNKLAEDKPRCRIPMSDSLNNSSLVDLNHPTSWSRTAVSKNPRSFRWCRVRDQDRFSPDRSVEPNFGSSRIATPRASRYYRMGRQAFTGVHQPEAARAVGVFDFAGLGVCLAYQGRPVGRREFRRWERPRSPGARLRRTPRCSSALAEARVEEPQMPQATFRLNPVFLGLGAGYGWHSLRP